MAVVLNITTVPQTFTAGTFDVAATTINQHKWKITVAPNVAAIVFTDGHFRAVLGQPNGGLWFQGTSLELYTTPDDNLAFSLPLTWIADQPITITVDASLGVLQVSISGATTGNGTFSLAESGPYINSTIDLEIGKQGSNSNSDFPGTISSIEDFVTGESVSPAAISIAGGTVQAKRQLIASITTAVIALAGGGVGENLPGKADSVSPAAIALTGRTVTARRTYADAVVPSAIALVGGAVGESRGGLISLGPTAVDFQRFGFADRDSNITMNTPVSGAVVLLCAGGKSSDISVVWTDSKNVAAPAVVGVVVEYPDYPGYGTIIAMTPAPMVGGTGHAFTQPVTPFDENTTFGLTAIVTGSHPRVSEVHNNVANASGTTQQTSPSITVDGEALLVAYWWGAAPVTPPFTGGVGVSYTAVPNNGFTVAQSYLVNNEAGEVQGAMAYLYVPAGSGSSTHNVTWTHSPAQGAQLRVLAIQPALFDALTPASLAIVGQAIGERRTTKISITPAALTLAGGTITESPQAIDQVLPATLTLISGTLQIRQTAKVLISQAAVLLTGSDVHEHITGNLQDTVSPAQLVILSGAIADRRTSADASSPAVLALAGGLVNVRRSSADLSTSSALVLVGGSVFARPARKDTTASAVLVIVGSDVQDHVVTGSQDVVSPAALTLIGGPIQVRRARAVLVSPAVIVMLGTEVTAMRADGAPASDFLVPPGRTPAQLVGHVDVPSIESRASEQGHLTGTVRSRRDV